MTPMRIGILCFPSLGGSGVIASELAEGLTERGHEVHLFATERPPRALGQALQFHRIDVPGYPVLEHAPYTLAAASQILDVARRERLELIQVHYAVPHAASGLLVRAALAPNAPLLVTSLHGSDVTHIGSTSAYRSIVASLIAASDGVTVPSEYLRREAQHRFALDGSKAIEVIPNFVDTDRFTPTTEREEIPVLFHVSNFRPVKRIGLLLDVFAHVRRQRRVRLTLVGNGPERPMAEARAQTLGIAEDVSFLGDIGDFIPLLRRADAFLLTSESESFGLAALEAMSAGLPVFAYRVGGIPEVVPPEAGVLAEPGVETLGDALLAAFAEPGRLATMGAAARRHALAHFQRAPALDRTERYFRQLLSRRPTGDG